MTASLFNLRRLLSFGAASVAGWLAVSSAGAQVVASFSPPQLVANQVGQYQLKLTDENVDQNQPPNPPAVPGLELQYNTQSTQTQVSINNGSFSKHTTFIWIYLVRAPNTGSYTVPPFSFRANGKTFSVPAATLTVTDAPPPPPPGTGPYSLLVKVPSQQVYVGEKIPLEITLMVRDDVRLLDKGSPTETGDAFEQIQPNQHLDEVQSEAQLNDHTYTTFTWHIASAALKSGNQTLKFSVPIAIMVNSGNPFGFGEQQQGTLDSTPLTFNVLSLPTAGRPGNFTGGIGLFSIGDPTLSSTDLQVGTPVTLTLSISGKGNFDRLEAPPLDTGSLWRAYKPKSSFQASDPSGYEGTKTFEYVLMPMSENITAVPPPQFNFFNPETKSYVDLTPRPIAVTVKPPAPGQAPVPLPAVSNSAAAQTPTLIGPRTAPGSWVSPTLAPVFFSPYFFAAQALPAIVLGAVVFVRRRQLRLENDPAYARRLRARRTALADIGRARAAATAGRAPEFFTLAQHALQEAASASAEWKHEHAAEALTWDEFDAHLLARGASVETRQSARDIFTAGDALRFGGFTPDPETLARVSTSLDTLVRELLRLA